MRIDTCYILTMMVLCLLYETEARMSRVCTPFTKRFGPHPQGICGNRIDEFLSTICVHGYNGRRRGRRDTQQDQLEDKNGIFIQREDANSYLVKRIKRSNYYDRGIVCECCYNQCAIWELSTYCKNGISLLDLVKRSIPDNDQSYQSSSEFNQSHQSSSEINQSHQSSPENNQSHQSSPENNQSHQSSLGNSNQLHQGISDNRQSESSQSSQSILEKQSLTSKQS